MHKPVKCVLQPDVKLFSALCEKSYATSEDDPLAVQAAKHSSNNPVITSVSL